MGVLANAGVTKAMKVAPTAILRVIVFSICFSPQKRKVALTGEYEGANEIPSQSHSLLRMRHLLCFAEIAGATAIGGYPGTYTA